MEEDFETSLLLALKWKTVIPKSLCFDFCSIASCRNRLAAQALLISFEPVDLLINLFSIKPQRTKLQYCHL